eukprot:scaffold2585_cov368-Prasinococcus_capsulatus_cf.AAC.14
MSEGCQTKMNSAHAAAPQLAQAHQFGLHVARVPLLGGEPGRGMLPSLHRSPAPGLSSEYRWTKHAASATWSRAVWAASRLHSPSPQRRRSAVLYQGRHPLKSPSAPLPSPPIHPGKMSGRNPTGWRTERSSDGPCACRSFSLVDASRTLPRATSIEDLPARSAPSWECRAQRRTALPSIRMATPPQREGNSASLHCMRRLTAAHLAVLPAQLFMKQVELPRGRVRELAVLDYYYKEVRSTHC